MSIGFDAVSVTADSISLSTNPNPGIGRGKKCLQREGKLRIMRLQGASHCCYRGTMVSKPLSPSNSNAIQSLVFWPAFSVDRDPPPSVPGFAFAASSGFCLLLMAFTEGYRIWKQTEFRERGEETEPRPTVKRSNGPFHVHYYLICKCKGSGRRKECGEGHP